MQARKAGEPAGEVDRPAGDGLSLRRPLRRPPSRTTRVARVQDTLPSGCRRRVVHTTIRCRVSDSYRADSAIRHAIRHFAVTCTFACRIVSDRCRIPPRERTGRET